jgi:hypothetical protein
MVNDRRITDTGLSDFLHWIFRLFLVACAITFFGAMFIL